MAIKTVYKYYLLSPNIERVIYAKKLVEARPNLPNHLIIKSINLDSSIDYVGLTPDGAMDIGTNPDVVGWYMLGVRPGDVGSAVIAGHYGWEADGSPAIFNDLSKLISGDEIFIVDQLGQEFVFVVKKIRKYNPDADASEIFKSDDDKSHLNLITCNGTWVNDKQSYSDRLVVFADLKE